MAATDVEAGGVVSPGGVGFDISCGVRLLVSASSNEDVQAVRGRLMYALDAAIPRGLGRGGIWQLSRQGQLEGLLTGGARYAVECGHGVQHDLERCEDGGVVAGTDVSAVGRRARDAGLYRDRRRVT